MVARPDKSMLIVMINVHVVGVREHANNQLTKPHPPCIHHSRHLPFMQVTNVSVLNDIVFTAIATWQHPYGLVVLWGPVFTVAMISRCLFYDYKRYISRFSCQVWYIVWYTLLGKGNIFPCLMVAEKDMNGDVFDMAIIAVFWTLKFEVLQQLFSA